MEPLGRYLHQQGFSVWIPFLGSKAQDDIWLHDLGRLRTPPVLIGFSRGGLLALKAAISTAICGLVTINTPLDFGEEMDLPPAWRQELLRIRSLLARVTAPALIVQSVDDTVIDPGNGQLIYDLIGSCSKELWSCRGDHLVILRAGRQELFAKVATFAIGQRSVCR